MNIRKCFSALCVSFFLFSLQMLFFLCEAQAQTSTSGRTGMTTQEEDGSPDLFCRSYKFSNDSLTDNGDGSCTISTGGGGGGGTGSLRVKDSGSTIVSNAGTMDFLGNGWTIATGGTAGTANVSLAGIDAGYLTLATTTGLSYERAFTAGAGLSAVDGGAGSTYTLNATVTPSSTNTLTNKTIDGDNNTISNLALGAEVSATSTSTLTFSGVATDITTVTNEDLTLDPSGSGTLSLNAGSGGVSITTDAGNSNISLNPHGTGAIRFPDLTNCDTIDTDANGDLSCGTDDGGGSAGGSNQQFQYNNSGSFGGIASVLWDDSSMVLTDDQVLALGTSKDWRLFFNDATDDQLILSTTLTSTASVQDAMFTMLVPSGVASSQRLFRIAKGTQASYTNLLEIDDNGDFGVRSSIYVTDGVTTHFLCSDSQGCDVNKGLRSNIAQGSASANDTYFGSASTPSAFFLDASANAVVIDNGVSFALPDSTSVVVDASGEIAIDTNTDGDLIDTGSIVFHDGTRKQWIVSLDTTTGFTDGQVVMYDGTSDKWKVDTVGGSGDMLKSTYDANNDGIVDVANTASVSTLASADDNDTSIATTSFVQQEINGAGGTNLSCSSGQCNVDDAFIVNSTSDTMTGTLTADGLTLGANENITLGAETLDHNGTDFAFSDAISVSGTVLATSYEDNATCIDDDSDRLYGDKDCDGTKDAGENYIDIAASTSSEKGGFQFSINGGGSAITTGILAHQDIAVRDCSIDSYTILANTTNPSTGNGSIAIAVYKDTYANYPPTSADIISASTSMKITSGSKATDSTLTGWTKTVTAGDVLRYEVISASTLQEVKVDLSCDD